MTSLCAEEGGVKLEQVGGAAGSKAPQLVPNCNGATLQGSTWSVAAAL